MPLYTHVSNDLTVELLKRHAGNREPKRLLVPITGALRLVSLMPDYHLPKGPGFYSIEIKVFNGPCLCINNPYLQPKYSCCLSVLKAKPPLNSQKHYILCRFCSHNYTGPGFESNDIRYCPSLLFSRDPVLVRHAIIGLCQNPRNNFRLFNDGQLAPISSLEESLLQQTVDYICSDLLVEELARRLDETWEKILLSASYSDGDLMRAVILRDCSIILHGLHTCTDLARVRANIIDFDPKPGVRHGKYAGEITELRRLAQRFRGEEV